jgi:transcriptional regulator with XRE-family HTH domain
MEIGDRIRKLREEKGLSLRELESRIKISYSHLSRIENNKKKPNLDLLELLAEFYDVPLHEFFGDKVETPKKLEDVGVEWITFAEEMKKQNLTPEEIKNILNVVQKLNINNK